MAIMLISTFTLRGSPFTATVSRAGKSPLKYFAYTSFTALNNDISLRKMLVFITLLKSISAAASMALRLCITWWVSAAMSVASTVPVFGLMPTCPEINSVWPASTAWLYGPIGAGASLV
jgi:hypothetical protein